MQQVAFLFPAQHKRCSGFSATTQVAQRLAGKSKKHANTEFIYSSFLFVGSVFPVLAPHRLYYLHNFQSALSWLAARYADVLSEQEQGFFTQFAQLSTPSQALLVRMLMRQGPWFRESKLQYEEIGDIPAAAGPLETLGWLRSETPMPVSVLFALHTRAELHQLLPSSINPALRKQEWLQALQEAQLGEKPYAHWHPQSTERVWCVDSDLVQTAERFRLMFFGNLRQSWSEFVLADLGIFRYENVQLPASARAFQAREDVDTYLRMQTCRDAWENQALETAEVWQQLMQLRSFNPWLEQRRAKLLMRLGQACEKAQDWATAQSIYAQCRYPGARHRHIRVLELQGAYEAALALAQTALHAPESEQEQQQLQRMLPRLLRHTGMPTARPRAITAVVEDAVRMDLCLPWPDAPCSVEYALRDHWHSEQAPVFYVENTLITALFGLLCWPAIFAPLQGAFFHPFQSAPADFAAPDFAERRADVFAQCLQELEDGRYCDTIMQRFADKHGTQNPLVIWPAIHTPLLQLALHCIPAVHLQRMFERLQANPREHRTGLPDLIRFWPAEQRYEMVEVKAPGDKLQDNQIRWLQYFAQHGIPARVCHVTWQTEEVPELCT